jgi:hypothetical protein
MPYQAATSGPLAKIGAQLRAHPQNRLTSLENIEDKVFYQMIAFAHVILLQLKIKMIVTAFFLHKNIDCGLHRKKLH